MQIDIKQKLVASTGRYEFFGFTVTNDTISGWTDYISTSVANGIACMVGDIHDS